MAAAAFAVLLAMPLRFQAAILELYPFVLALFFSVAIVLAVHTDNINLLSFVKITVWICVLMFAFSMHLDHKRKNAAQFAAFALSQETISNLEGEVVSSSKSNGSNQSWIDVALANCHDAYNNRGSASGRLRVSVKPGSILPGLGSVVRFPVNARHINYAVKTGLIFMDNSKIQVLKKPVKTATPAVLRSAIRGEIIEQLDSLEEGSANFLKALLLGDRHAISPRMKKVLEVSGTSHILALSGLHVSILAVFFFFLCSRIVPEPQAFICVIVLLAVYTWIAGPRPSLVRAVIMYGLFANSLAKQAILNRYAVLAAAYFLCVFLFPDDAGSLSMQYTFAAVAGIYVLGRPVRRILSPYVPSPVAAALSVSFGAFLAVCPLSIIYFGEVYPAAVLLNLLIVPLVTLIVWSGFVYLLLAGTVWGWAISYFSCLTGILEKLAGFGRVFPAIRPQDNCQIVAVLVVWVLLIVLILAYGKIQHLRVMADV